MVFLSFSIACCFLGPLYSLLPPFLRSIFITTYPNSTQCHTIIRTHYIPDIADISHWYIIFRGQPSRYAKKGSHIILSFECISIDSYNIARYIARYIAWYITPIYQSIWFIYSIEFFFLLRNRFSIHIQYYFHVWEKTQILSPLKGTRCLNWFCWNLESQTCDDFQILEIYIAEYI